MLKHTFRYVSLLTRTCVDLSTEVCGHQHQFVLSMVLLTQIVCISLRFPSYHSNYIYIYIYTYVHIYIYIDIVAIVAIIAIIAIIAIMLQPLKL